MYYNNKKEDEMADKKIKHIKNDNKVTQGVIGFILSILGLLFAFQKGTDNYLLFIIFLIMIIIGIILVAKALSD